METQECRALALATVCSIRACRRITDVRRSACGAEGHGLRVRFASSPTSIAPPGARGMRIAPARFYAKEEGLVFYDLAPFSYHSWKEYHEGVKKEFFDNMESGTLSAGKDLKVSRHGTVAWTTVPMHLSEKTKDGKECRNRHSVYGNLGEASRRDGCWCTSTSRRRWAEIKTEWSLGAGVEPEYDRCLRHCVTTGVSPAGIDSNLGRARTYGGDLRLFSAKKARIWTRGNSFGCPGNIART